MSISAVEAVTSVSYTHVYALSSPFLNGIVRVSDAVRDAADVSSVLTQRSVTPAVNAATAPPREVAPVVESPPPTPARQALSAELALRAEASAAITAIGTAASVIPAPAAPSLTQSALTGDAARLVQAYGAVALIYGTPALPLPNIAAAPAVTPIAPVARVAGPARVKAFG